MGNLFEEKDKLKVLPNDLASTEKLGSAHHGHRISLVILLTLIFWSLCIGGFYFYTAHRGTGSLKYEGLHPTIEPSVSTYGYIHMLTWSLAHRHLELPIQPSVQFLSLPDPYSLKVWTTHSYPGDTSYYKGKFYLYWGVTPILVLFLPWYFLTGCFFPQWIAAGVFSFLGYLFSLFCVIDLWRIIQPNKPQSGPLASPLWASVTALSLGMGSFIPYLLQDTFIHTVVAESAYCFGMLGAWALLRAWITVHKKGSCNGWLFLAGISLALAVGSKPSWIILVILALSLFLCLWWERKFSLRGLLSFGIPYGAYGILLALYNHVRFDSWHEFGLRYQIDYITQILTSTHAVDILCKDFLFNLRDYLILPPRFFTHFPYILPRWDWCVPPLLNFPPDSSSVGALFIFPALLLLLVLPLIYGSLSTFVRFYLIGCILVALFQLLLVSFFSHTGRYLVDFMPLALLSALIIGFVLIKQSSGQKKIAVVLLLICSALWCFAVSFFSSWLGFPQAKGALDIPPISDRLDHWRLAVNLHNDNDIYLTYYASALIDSGACAEAVPILGRAIDINPSYAEAKFDLGKCLLGEGRTAEAISYMTDAVKLGNPFQGWHLGLATALAKAGRYAEAIDQLKQESTTIDNYQENLKELTNALAKQEAEIAALRENLARNLSNPSFLANLGQLLFYHGDEKEGIGLTEKAARLQPENPQVQNNLAWMLATARDHSLRDGKRAAELALAAYKSTGSHDTSYLETLAAASAAQRDTASALTVARKALELTEMTRIESKAAGNITDDWQYKERASTLRAAISLYEKGMPYDLPGLVDPTATHLPEGLIIKTMVTP